MGISRLLVATQNGFIYVYDMSIEEGGDCRLVVKHDLRNIVLHQSASPGNSYDEYLPFEDFVIVNSTESSVDPLQLPQRGIDDILSMKGEPKIRKASRRYRYYNGERQ